MLNEYTIFKLSIISVRQALKYNKEQDNLQNIWMFL